MAKSSTKMEGVGECQAQMNEVAAGASAVFVPMGVEAGRGRLGGVVAGGEAGGCRGAGRLAAALGARGRVNIHNNKNI